VKKIIRSLGALLMGVSAAVVLLWVSATLPAKAGSNVFCVNQSGTGCDAVCGGGCFNAVQAAINAAPDNSEIRIAGGTYTETGGTVIVITKPLEIRGSYNQPCGEDDLTFDPTQTILDAGWGGSVISITNAGKVSLEFLTLTHGDGTGNLSGMGAGGGIFNLDTKLLVAQSVITNNLGSHAGRGWGGGLYSSLSGHFLTVQLEMNQIISNTACSDPSSHGSGGGAYLNGGNLFMEENQIVGNQGNSLNECRGSGTYISFSSQGVIVNNLFKENTCGASQNSYGTGLYVTMGKNIIGGNHFEGNYADSGNGGGLEIAWSDVEITSNWFISNTNDAGGGMYIRSTKPVTITNNLIANNTVSYTAGGIYLVENSPGATPALLVNNTIVNNAHDAITTWGDIILTMTNNLLSNNPIGINAVHPVSLTLSADTNLFWNTSDPLTGTNALITDPLLMADYHLEYASPAIDSGLPVPWLPEDLVGNPRPSGGGYDIGAYERQILYLPYTTK